jgi:hypothetical protein
MMMPLNLKEIIAEKNWLTLVRKFLPAIVADSFSFIELMHIVGSLVTLANDEMESQDPQIDFVRDYCVNLMIILRAKFPQDWKRDWKNEAFLGIACKFVYREEEAFQYIQNAFQQLEDPPQSLLMSYISAGQTCDHYLSSEQIKELSLRAMTKGITFEVALHMATLSYMEGNEKERQYWKKKALEAEKEGTHTAIIVPNLLKNVCKIRKGYSYEK